MSRAMGSSCVFTCWGAASWHGGRVMLVFGARAAAGAGSCAGGGATFGVVVVCGCTLVAVLAGGVAPVCALIEFLQLLPLERWEKGLKMMPGMTQANDN